MFARQVSLGTPTGPFHRRHDAIDRNRQHRRLRRNRFLCAQRGFPLGSMSFPVPRQLLGQSIQTAARGAHPFQFSKQSLALAGRQMRRNERRLTRRPRREVSPNDARPQFQRANTSTAAARRPIQVPCDLDRPRRRQIRFRRRQSRAVGHARHGDFVRADIVVHQFFGQQLALNRLDPFMQFVFKSFKVGGAVRPVLTPVPDKLSQSLNRRAFPNRIRVAQCHRSPPCRVESVTRSPLCMEVSRLSSRAD